MTVEREDEVQAGKLIASISLPFWHARTLLFLAL
jgi:hypothetical protein